MVETMSVYACNPSRRKAFKAVLTNASSLIDFLTNFEPFPQLAHTVWRRHH